MLLNEIKRLQNKILVLLSENDLEKCKVQTLEENRSNLLRELEEYKLLLKNAEKNWGFCKEEDNNGNLSENKREDESREGVREKESFLKKYPLFGRKN